MSDPSRPSNTPVAVRIGGTAPPYAVALEPPGPYRITEPGSTLTLQLDSASVRGGFALFGIGFRDAQADAQLTAALYSRNAPNDTLVITDAKTKDGYFEFVMLYQDGAGGATVYGFDPAVENEEPA